MGAVRLFFHGQLQIRAYGRDPERFLNLCAGTGVFAGIVVCHNCYSLFWVFARRALPRAFQFQRWAMTSSIRPYSLASSAVI